MTTLHSADEAMGPDEGRERRGAARRRSRRDRRAGTAPSEPPATDDAPAAALPAEPRPVTDPAADIDDDLDETTPAADPLAIGLAAYQQLIDLSPLGMLVVDHDARVLLHNDLAGELLGTHLQDLANSRFQHPVVDEPYEVRRHDLTGMPRTLRIECTPFAGFDHPAWSVSIRDVATVAAEPAAADAFGSSTHDPLTGLPGRELFLNEVYERVRHRPAAGEDRAAVVAIDLERFVVIDERIGHLAADRVLQTVAARLTSSIRPADHISRFGDDDFAILLAPQPQAAHLAVTDRIDEVLARPITVDDLEIHVSPVIGIAELADTDDEHTIIERATAAMVVTTSGPARLAPMPSDAGTTAAGSPGSGAVARAVSEGQMFVQYQPIFTVADNAIAGFEAVVRWEHPDDGLVSPDEFIRIAEEHGRIVPLGDWVIAEVCQQIATWRDDHPDYLVPPVSINVSARQMSTTDLRRRVGSALAGHGLGPEAIRFEITEDVLLDGDPRVESLLRGLVADGIALVLDGFGTGTSSLTHLQLVPLAGLKIDRSFVARLMDDGPAAQLVLAAVGAGQAFDIPVIAMGVETTEQKAVLARWGCDFAQGYLLGRPMSAVEASRFFARNPESLRVRPSGPLLRSSGTFARPAV